MNKSNNLINETEFDSDAYIIHGRSSRRKPNLLLVLGLVIIAGLLLGFALGSYLNQPPELIEPTGSEHTDVKDEMTGGPILADEYKEDFYTFLVVGTDYEDYHTDTIMVISLDTAADGADIVSIPRDTQVDVSRNPQKINAAYGVGGIKQLNKEIKSIIGFVPNYHIAVSLEAFKELVDAVGGVEFDVPKNMDKVDTAQGLHIHLKKGIQILDGDKALQLVRYRGYPDADMGRIKVQQRFLMALARKLLRVSNITKIDDFIDIFNEHVETNLSLRDMQWFARKVMQFDPEKDITVQTLPFSGSGDYRGHNYLYLEANEVINMVNQTINPYTRDITIEDVSIIRLED